MRISRLAWSAAVLIFMIAAIMALKSSRAQNAQSASILGSSHSVNLTWQPSPGASSYYVYRSTTSGSQYQKIGSSASPSYKDAPVRAGTTSYYVVTAVTPKGESKYSSEIKAVVPK